MSLGENEEIKRKLASIVVFYILLAISYWTVFTDAIRFPITWVLAHSPQATAGVSSTGIIIPDYNSKIELLKAAAPIFIDNLHLPFILGFTGIGVFISLYNSDRRYLLFLVSLLLGGIFVVPNPIWIPLRGLIIIERWAIIAIPLILPTLGIGLYNTLLELCTSERTSHFKKVATFILIFMLVFSSITVGVRDPSLTNMAGYDKYGISFISEEGIQSSEFVENYQGENKIHATGLIPAYLIHFLQLSEIEVVTLNANTDRVLYNEGLYLFQSSSIENSSVRVKIIAQGGYYDNPTTVRTSVSDNEIKWDRKGRNVIYTNSRIDIIHEK
jgi:hypothetical protein